MNRNTKNQPQESKPGRNVFSNLVLGLRVLLGELQWIGLKGLRAFELKQLKKRRREECTALGEAVAEQLQGVEASTETPLPPCNDQTLLALKQIRFLDDEIDQLARERKNMREEFETRRKASLGVNKE